MCFVCYPIYVSIHLSYLFTFTCIFLRNSLVDFFNFSSYFLVYSLFDLFIYFVVFMNPISDEFASAKCLVSSVSHE